MSNPFDSTEMPGPRRVLVLGDIMLDQYTWGRAERVSPEAPVFVMQAFVHVQRPVAIQEDYWSGHAQSPCQLN